MILVLKLNIYVASVIARPFTITCHFINESLIEQIIKLGINEVIIWMQLPIFISRSIKLTGDYGQNVALPHEVETEILIRNE